MAPVNYKQQFFQLKDIINKCKSKKAMMEEIDRLNLFKESEDDFKDLIKSMDFHKTLKPEPKTIAKTIKTKSKIKKNKN